MKMSDRSRKGLRWIAGGAVGTYLASWGMGSLGALAMPTPVAPLAAAPHWSCQNVRWADAPHMKENRAVGKMLAECTLEDAPTASLGSLYDSWLAYLKMNHEVISDPTPDNHDRISGLKLDLVEQIRDEGNGPLTIRKNAEVQSDRRNQFTYSSHSKAIEGSGNAALLRKLDTQIRITRTTEPSTRKNRILLTYSDQLAIERPWYAPDGIFLSEIERRSLKDFERARERLTTQILERIQSQSALASLIRR